MVLAIGSRDSAALPSPSAPAAGAQRYILLDGLRGILALAVVVHHFSSTSLHRDIFSSAGLAVDFFFCLSGFVIAHAYERKLRAGMSPASFMRRRLVRLYPMYLIGLAIGIVATLIVRPAGRDALAPLDWTVAALSNLVYVPYPNHAAIPVQAVVITAALFPFNGPAWSLFFEIVANAAYACIARISTFALIVLVALLALGTFQSWTRYGIEPGWSTDTFVGGAWRSAFGFFCGVLLYRWHRPGRPLGLGVGVAVALAVTAMVAAPLATPGSIYWIGATLFAVPPVVAFAAHCDFAVPPAARAACAYSGRLSYPIYCLHYPLLIALVGSGVRGAGAYALELAVYLAAVIALSHLVLTQFDEPLRSRLSTWREPA